MPFVTSRDGARIFYQLDCLVPPWSKPRGVVVMHHGVALTADAWAGWLPTLVAAGFRVVRLDMRGFGRSDPITPGYAWSMDDFFADLDALRAELGIGAYHFVGESIGGLIGLAVAARRPTEIKSLGLLSTPFDGSRIGPAMDAWRETIDREGMAGWSAALMPNRFPPGAISQEMYDWVFNLQKDCSPEAVCGIAEFIRGQDLTAELPAIEAPALIMAGDGSPFVGRALALDLHSALPGSEIRWYPGERHSLLLSRAADCAAAFVEFVDRRLPRPAE
jgi:3-oxoadipate enol-lactonase